MNSLKKIFILPQLNLRKAIFFIQIDLFIDGEEKRLSNS